MWFSLVMLIDTDRQLRSWGCLYYFNRFEKGGGSQFDWYFFLHLNFPILLDYVMYVLHVVLRVIYTFQRYRDIKYLYCMDYRIIHPSSGIILTTIENRITFCT